jgi:adenine-specific DNA-methyltransferase
MSSTRHAPPVATTSPDITADRLAALRDLFPEAFTEGKVDFARLRAALGDIVDHSPERYSFTWAGKRDAIRILQAPTAATLLPCPEESVDWESTHSIFIEGDDLEVLKLLYKPYFGAPCN